MANELVFSINCSISEILKPHILAYSFVILDGLIIGEPDNESMLHPLYLDFKKSLARIEAGIIADDIDLLQELHRRFELGLEQEHSDRSFFITYSTDPFMFWWNIAAVTSSSTIDIAYQIGKGGKPQLIRVDKATVEMSLRRFVESYELLQRIVEQI